MKNAPAKSGQVYLAGAGPGDPSLLTLRTLRLLQTADVILPDDLVSDEILALAPATAHIIPVGKRCGQPRITQAGIHDLLLKHASQNKSVLRLKSGDPLIFGRAGEEMAFLRRHNIPFEIVPGITTAFAVAASLQTPLTDRSAASRLVLATAHHAAGKLEVTPGRTPAASGPATFDPVTFQKDSTLVIYMPGRNFRTLADTLIASGIPPETPCVAVSKATTPQQQVHATTLGLLTDEAPGPAPVILLIGQAIQPTP